MRKSKGSTLLIVLFISLVALAISISMMQLSSTKTSKAVNNKYALQSYYAAEAGIYDVLETLTKNMTELSTYQYASDVGLPDSEETATELADGSGSYYVSNFNNKGDTITVECVGIFGGSKKKIVSELEVTWIDAFNFGLLSKQQVKITAGNIKYELDLHGNGAVNMIEVEDEDGNIIQVPERNADGTIKRSAGLDFRGNPENYETPLDKNIKATQSDTPAGYANKTDAYGGYLPAVEVPPVDFEYFQDQMLGKSVILTNQSVLTEAVAPGVTDASKHIMFTRDFINLDQRGIVIPAPAATGAMVPAKKQTLIASQTKNNSLRTLSLVVPVMVQPSTLVGLVLDKAYLANQVDDWVTPGDTHSAKSSNRYSLLLDNSYLAGNDDAPGQVKKETPTVEPTATPVPEPTATPVPEPTPEPEEDFNTDTPDVNESVVDDEEPVAEDPGDNFDTEPSNDLSGIQFGPTGSGGNGKFDVDIAAGDHGGRIYYIDNAGLGEVTINALGPVTNAIIVASGDIVFNGADTENNGRGLIDLVVASGGNITHNGRLESGCFYWLDGEFSQHGNSTFNNGRVMAQKDITLNGKFKLTSDTTLDDFAWMPKAIYVRSWREVDVYE